MRHARRATASATHSIRREPPGGAARFTATQAKNEFGRVLELALHGDTVVITKHDAPKAILISVDQFNKLAHATEATLDTLSHEFDALLAGMQSPKSAAAMKAAFAASPAELGKAAVTAARKRA
jgi:prevent-host-death family protein